MRAWPVVSRPIWSRSCPRALSTRCPERVDVRCGSAGHVTIDLFNAPETSPESALLVHLPPFPSADGSEAHLPKFLEELPVASINYRWGATSQAAADHDTLVPLCWPTPVHDTALAFAWLVDNLAPPRNARRDIYVYGSHLGAGLAASLSLTEAHVHDKFGIRGVVAYNGIYNWTMFLPDHRINKLSKRTKNLAGPTHTAEASHLRRLQEKMPNLFVEPPNLFDPFASPSLFFHTPGLLLPRSFTMSTEDAAMIDYLAGDEHIPLIPPKAPRKSHLIFPPRISTLKIPETLLLYDSPPRKPSSSKAKRGRPRKRAKAFSGRHTFEAQAKELAELMRHSIAAVEMKQRSKWDKDMHDTQEEEAHRRVQAVDVGPETTSIQLCDAGQEVARAWLQDRMRIAPQLHTESS